MKKTVSLLAVLLVFWAKSAWALDMEYYTYGGFDLMVQAFNLVALIFSDIDYKSLLPSFAILGLIMGAAGWVAGELSGAKQMPLGWALKTFAGIVIFIGLFVPTGHVAIYDATLNKTRTIGGVPNGVILVAGFLNKIERVIVRICDTAAGPASSYSGNAGGIGFNLLAGMSNAQDIYASMSMEEYMDKCVIFETMRPGTTIGFGDFTGNNTDFLTTLAQAVNPAVFTVYYEASNPGGSPITCTDAWNKLRPIFSAPGAYDNALNKTCSKAFLNGSDPAQLQSCKQIIENTVNYSTGSSYTYDTILKQSQISKMLYHTFTGDAQQSAALQANRKVTSGGFGTGIAMNEWVPIIKSILNALAICLVPFLALLLPTPIVGKVLSAMVGFFVFLTVWGACDAVIHTAGMVYASNSFQEIGPNNLGMLGMAAMPTLGAKTLAMFGYIRSSGLMLAAVFTQLLIKFGGSALAHLAGGLMSSAGQGGQEAGKMLTPEGRSAQQQELIRSAAEMRVESQEKFSGRGAAMAFQELQRVKAVENLGISAKQAGLAADLGSLAAASTAQQSFGTKDGMATSVVGPDGNVIQGSIKSMTTDGAPGWEQNVLTGADGSGKAEAVGAAGKGTWSVGSDGKWSLTNAQVNAADSIKLGKMMVEQKTHAIAHNVGSSTSWDKMLNDSKSNSATDADAKAFADQHTRSSQENLQRQFGDGSAFSKSADKGDLARINGAISAGAKFMGVGVSGEKAIQMQYGDGTVRKIDVSEGTMAAASAAVGRAEADSRTNTLTSAQGGAYAASWAKRTGDSDTTSALDEIRNINRNQASHGADLMTSMVDNHAKVRYGDNSPEHVRMSMNDINHMATSGPSGVNSLNDEVQGFISGKGYWGTGHSMPPSAGPGHTVRGEVDGHAGAAATATANVPTDFTGRAPARNHLPDAPGMPTVDVSAVPTKATTTQNADNLRNENKKEVNDPASPSSKLRDKMLRSPEKKGGYPYTGGIYKD